MAGDLSFNITALDNASKTFVKMAEQVDRLSKKIDKLDGKDATVDVNVNTSSAESKLNRFLDRSADKARRNGALLSKAMLTPLGAGLAGLPAAAATASAGVAAALGGVPLLFGGIAAAVLSSSQEMKTAYGSLADHVLARTKAMAAPLESTFVGIADKVGRTFDGVSGDLQRLFNSAQGPLTELTDGLLDMATIALPGLVRAAENSQAAMQGLSEVARQAGGGVKDFFTAVSTTGPGVTQTLATLGHVARDAMGFLGQFLANLANNAGPALADFRYTLQGVYSILLNLTSNGFSLLSGAVSGFTDAINAALTVINSLTAALGDWIGPLAYLYGQFKALNLITFGALGRQFDGLSGKIRGATGWVGKLQAGLKGGFKGLLVTGGLMLVTKLIEEFTEDARIAKRGVENLKNVQERYNAALATTSGILTEVSKKEILRGPEAKKAAENVRKLGLSYEQFVSGVTKGTPEANAMFGALDRKLQTLLTKGGAMPGMSRDIAKAFVSLRTSGQGAAGAMEQIDVVTETYRQNLIHTVEAEKKGIGWVNKKTEAFKTQLVRLADLNTQYGSLVGASDKLTQSQIAASEKVRNMSAAEWGANRASETLAVAFSTLSDKTASAKQQVSALKTALDILAGRKPKLEEAMQGFNDLIRGLSEKFKDLGLSTLAANKKLFTAAGAIDTTTEAGSQLYTSVTKVQTSMIQVANAMRDAGKPTSEITTKLASMRDRLKEQLTALGLTPEQIQKVITKYGLMPNQVTTAVMLKGDQQAMNEIQKVFDKLAGLPDNTPVKVDALTFEAKRALTKLGYTIVQLPDGSFKVYSNTKPGRRAAEAFIKEYDGRIVDVTLRADWVVTGNVETKLRNMFTNAQGNILRFAGGGKFQPMAAGLAQRVKPNTWRIIGDRAKDDEAYIPINRSARSQALLHETAKDMGFALQPMASGGILGAAKELLSHLRGGGNMFEDFSFRGQRSGLNEKLADLFYSSRKGFDFGSAGTGAAVKGFLSGIVNAKGLTKRKDALDRLTQSTETFAATVKEQTTPSLSGFSTTVNDPVLASLLLLERHIGVLAPQSLVTMQQATASTAQQQNTAWTLIGNVATSQQTRMGNSQQRLQSFLASSWTYLSNLLSTRNTQMSDSQGRLQSFMGGSWGWIARNTHTQVGSMNDAFGTLRTGMGRVRSAMSETRRWADVEFGRMYGAAADPTRRVLSGPFNDGIIAAWNKLDKQFSFDNHVSKVAIPFAQGSEDHRAQIARPGAMRLWAEPETGGEAYIPLAGSKRGRSTNILSKVAERFGYSLMPFARGGLVQQMSSMVRSLFPSARVTSGFRPGDPGFHGRGQAIDFVTNNMVRAGHVMTRRFPNSLEIIHNPGTSWDSGHRVPPSFWGPATWAGHRDHIHWATGGLQGGAGATVALDPRAMVAEAFADAQGMVERFRKAWSHNQMGRIDSGAATDALKGVKSFATDKFQSLFSGGGNAGNIALGKAMAAAMGWTGAQWQALKQLWINESGWRTFATNPSSGAYGIPQSLPGSKMASAGADWRTNPSTQIKWGMGYISNRYGNPVNALGAWQSRSPHWYGKGLPPTVFRKPTLIGVGESGPERVSVTPVGRGSEPAPNVEVRVFVGNQEITNIVDTRIEVHERESSQKLRAGRR